MRLAFDRFELEISTPVTPFLSNVRTFVLTMHLCFQTWNLCGTEGRAAEG